MASNPTRPDEKEVLDAETCRILDERLVTEDQDAKTARPADEFIAELRAKFESRTPRP